MTTYVTFTRGWHGRDVNGYPVEDPGSSCSVCGCLVASGFQGTHLTWHDKISPEDGPHEDLKTAPKIVRNPPPEPLSEQFWSTILPDQQED